MWAPHEYWVDEADIDNMWHCARWRTYRHAFPVLRHMWIVVGECGRDVVEKAGKRGWKKTANKEQFERDLHKYARLLHAERARGVVYTCGQHSGEWDDFNTDQVSEFIQREHLA